MASFEPDKDRPHDDTMTYGEHVRAMKSLASRVERAIAERDRLAPFETKATELEAQVSTLPDVGKMTKRLERAEKEAAEWQEKHAAYVAETTSTTALLTAGVTDADDQKLVRWAFEQSGAEDLSKWIDGPAKAHKHLMAAGLFAAPAPVTGGAPPPPTNAAPPKINGGVTPPKPPGQSLSLQEMLAKPRSWHADPANRATINEINGVPHLTRKSTP